ncbi:hypothetical protein BT96DRAFT_1026440 [Gymnopus androsaceus JB14]|uniref:Protein kinase domain-containing protein n=1 Tax=Gymnopus androsaceus JB14 TaxID=1447944 RepID=A0A6A4GJJ1_9AGAR|nr:hypothetical protein BT96DRAFT_1026440 [Gymnopus androsaceus JB14]
MSAQAAPRPTERQFDSLSMSSFATVTPQELLAWTEVDALRRSAVRHITSTSTRTPSEYDRHLPVALQAKAVLFGKHRSQSGDDGSFAAAQYLQRLSARPAVLELLRGDAGNNLRSRWRNLRRVKHISVVNEDGVTEAERDVSRVVFDLAALALMDLSKEQLDNIDEWALLAVHSSTETDSKADLLLGLHEKENIMDDDERNRLKYSAVWSLVNGLDQRYFMYLFGLECKNLNFLGDDSMVYLSLLLLSHLLQTQSLKSIWPQTECTLCSQFRNSHQVLSMRVEPVIPVDSSDTLGLIPADDLIDDLEDEILRLLQLASEGRVHDSEVTSKRPPNVGKFYLEVHEPMKNLLKSLGYEDILIDVMKWVTPARNVFVQTYSQMIRHNLTFSAISSHNKSFFLQRQRKSGQAIISPLQSAITPGHVIRRALLFMDAWDDAVSRSKNESLAWDDPYKPDNYLDTAQLSDDHLELEGGDNPKDADYKPEDDASGEDDEKLCQSKDRKKKKGKGSPLPDGNPFPPCGGGGAGGAGAGGSGSAGGSQDFGGGSSNAKKRSASNSKSSDISQAKRGRKLNMDIKEIHLAFNCLTSQPLLQSSGFSKYTRIPIRQTPSTNVFHFSIPFRAVTPPRGNPVAFAGITGGDPDSSYRRSSVSSIASGASVGSSANESTSWSSPVSVTSSAYTPPPSSTSSSPTAGKAMAMAMVHPISALGPLKVSSGMSTSIPDPAMAEFDTGSVPILVCYAGIILDRKISQSAVGIVWGGNIILEDLDVAAEPCSIAVKLADWELDSEKEGNMSDDGKLIVKEAKIYEHLAQKDPELNIIPHFYGVFDNSGSTALVLEYSGERLTKDAFRTLDHEKKVELFDMVHQLHKLEIMHNDLNPRNILMNEEGRLRVIDFHYSELNHQCPGPTGCEELKEFAKSLDLNF